MLKLSRSSIHFILGLSLTLLLLLGQSDANIFETQTLPGKSTTLREQRIDSDEEIISQTSNIDILRATETDPIEPNYLNFPGYDTLYWHDYSPSSGGYTIRGYQAGFGVRLMPEAYPAIITGVHHRVFRLNSDSMQIRFVDDDGSGGAPLTMLYKVDTVTSSYTTSFIYHALPAPACTIWDGSFYLFMLGNKHDNTVYLLNWLRDATLNAPSGIHWRHDTLGNYTSWNPGGDLEMGAVVEYHDVSIDSLSGLPNNNSVFFDSTYAMNIWCQELAGFSESSVPVILNIAGVHSDTGYLSLAPNSTNNATINWTVDLPEGTYSCTCYTALRSDSRKTNDTLFFDVSVTVPVTSVIWEMMAYIPQTPSGKNPKSGSCMAGLAGTGNIYFLKASNQPDFYFYDPATNTWTTLAGMPQGDKETGDGKNPKRGAAMAAYEPYKSVFVLRGNNRVGFWRYQCDTLDTLVPGWKKMANIPTGAKRPKYGTGLAVVQKEGNDYLFCMKGAKTMEFYVYDLVNDTWLPVSNPPVGASGKSGYKKGSIMAYDGSEWVYVLQGYYGSFFKYHVESDSWVELRQYDYKSMLNRDGKKKKFKDGAGMVFYNDNCYCLKGGNTVEVWKYATASDSWTQMPENWDIPLGPTGKKKVKDGGGMIMFGSYFWASKGKNTPELFRHSLPVESPAIANHLPDNQGTMGKRINSIDFKLTIAPNPAVNATMLHYSMPKAGPVTFKVYNITGSLIRTHTIANPTKQGKFLIDELPAGVYILRFNAGDMKISRKLVMEK